MHIQVLRSVALLAILSLVLCTSANAQCNGSTCGFASAPVPTFSAPANFSSFASTPAPTFDSYSGYVSAAPAPAQPSFPYGSEMVNAGAVYPSYNPTPAPIIGGPIGSPTPVASPIVSAPISSTPIYNTPTFNAPVYSAPAIQQPISFPSQTFTSSPSPFGTFSNFATPQCSGGNCPF